MEGNDVGVVAVAVKVTMICSGCGGEIHEARFNPYNHETLCPKGHDLGIRQEIPSDAKGVYKMAAALGKGIRPTGMQIPHNIFLSSVTAPVGVSRKY